MKVINLVQGSQEWLEFRRMGIGASDAPCIMGVGFQTPYQLYKNKIQGKEIPVNEYMQRGKENEAKALGTFSSMTGLKMVPKVVISSQYEWQYASLDGISHDHQAIVEIKCPGMKDHSSALNGRVPEKYYPQLQHQLCVTNLQKAFYFSFDGKDGVIVEIERDDDYIEKMLKKELEFYEAMLRYDPPKLMKDDYVILNDSEWNEVCEEYKRVKSQSNELKEKEEKLRERLISIAAERNVAGRGVRLTKILKKGVIDYKNIPVLKGVDLENYRLKSREEWRLSIDEDNGNTSGH